MMKKRPPAYTERLEQLEELLRKDPDNISLLLDIGYVYFNRAHIPKKALEYYNKALSFNPSNPTILHWIACVHFFERCDAKSAKEVLEKALIIDPNRPECLSLYASVIQDDPSTKPEDYLPYVKKTVQLAPDWPGPHEQLAVCLAQLGRWDEAESELQKTYELLDQDQPEPDNERETYFKHAVMGRGPSSREITDLIANRMRDQRSRGLPTYS